MHIQYLQHAHASGRGQWHFITNFGFEQHARHWRNPAHLRLAAVRLINAHDGDGALHALIIGIGNRRSKKHLLATVVHRRVDHFGNLQALGQKANASINFAQAFLAIQVITVFRAITVAGRPVHDFDDLGPLVINQLQQLGLERLVALRRHVVFAALGKRWQAGQLVIIVLPVGFLGESLVHSFRSSHKRRRKNGNDKNQKVLTSFDIRTLNWCGWQELNPRPLGS
ncbi:hypothetical protein D3C72_1695490 [compost metagenome]